MGNDTPRKIKDKNAPKKPLNAYNFYVKFMHDKLKEQNPGMSFQELSRLIAVEYKKLSQEERLKWNGLAKEDRIRYDTEMENYSPPTVEANETVKYSIGEHQNLVRKDHPISQPDRIRKSTHSSSSSSRKKKVKDPNAPKKNLTAYILFANHIREDLKEKHPDVTFQDMGRLTGMEFRKLSKDDRTKWENVAKQDKGRYETEIKAYNEKLAIIRLQEQQMLHALAKQQEQFHQSMPKLEGQLPSLKQEQIESLPKLEGQHEALVKQEEIHQSLPKFEGQHETLVKQEQIHQSLPKLEGQHEALAKQEQLPNLDDQHADEDDAPLTQQV